jgi:hypothetical protein
MPGRSRSIATRRILGLVLTLVCALASAAVTVPPRPPGTEDPDLSTHERT